MNNNEKETSLVKRPEKKKDDVQELEHQEKKTPYPKSVIFIIGNEFCERFSYYGMKAILTLYFVNKLVWSEDTATMIYHVFSGACYFTPIIGAIISDSFLGKFRTIFYISIIYALGNIVLSISAVPTIGFDATTVEAIGMLGLGLIAFGTGGIKPCVAAFGGDQFSADQEKQLQRFFSFFYISINAGSLISTFLTPKLRATACLGQKDCYSLAFGVPAILMVIALILFIIGKKMYVMVPPKGNILVEVCSCICYAIKKKFSSKGVKRESWLDYADDKYDRTLIQDIKPVLRVLFLYLPLPFFWALFDQQGSRWTLQATRMDGAVTEDFRIEPDQMQVVNPLFIILCIPLFEYVIYPAFAKIHFLVRPLQRMTVGGLLAAGSFVIAFFLQLALERTLPVLPDGDHGQLNIFNGIQCPLVIYGDKIKGNSSITVGPGQMHVLTDISSHQNYSLTFTSDCPLNVTQNDYNFTIEGGKVDSLLVSQLNDELHFLRTNDSLHKPEKGESDVRILFNDPSGSYDVNSTFKLMNDMKSNDLPVVNYDGTNIGSTNYVLISPGKYSLYIPVFENVTKLNNTEFRFKSGGNYIILLWPNGNNSLQSEVHNIVTPNTISLFLQIPQYITITCGEVMFSITGLEFSYSQAPVSMKAVLQAGWLMTVAFGNIIVVIVSKAAIPKQSTEFIAFAGMLTVVMGIFAVMAYFYQPVKKMEEEEEKNGKVIMNGTGKKNEAFVDDSTTKM